MHFKFIHKKDLNSFAALYADKMTGPVPITPWRAESQSINPFATDDDVLLIAAIDEDEKIGGYIGILPSMIKDTANKVYWISCWWVEPGKYPGLSSQLLEQFMDKTGKRCLFSDLSEKAVKKMESTGEFYIRERKGAIIRFRSGLNSRLRGYKPHGLKRQAIFFIHKIGIFKLFDLSLNIYPSWLIRKYSHNESNIFIHGVHRLPTNEMLNFISLNIKGNDITLPSEVQIEWWDKSQWLVKKSDRNSDIGNRYYFSSFADNFHYKWYELFESKVRIGVACLSYRDGVIKTMYLWYNEKRKGEFFASLFKYIICDKANHSLVTFQEEFRAYISSLNLPFLKWTEKVRFTGVSKHITEIPGEKIKMQDGDGDYIFT